MNPIKAIERPKLLHHRAQEAIRDYVLSNGLSAGDALPGEMELARQLGVSRNSVREAIRALESLGVLEVRRGRGVFVRAFTFEPLLEGLAYGLLFELREVEELLELRYVLETSMLERAMASLTADGLADVREIVARMEEKAARNESLEAEDKQFHALMFQGIENQTFLRLLDIFWMAYRKASTHLAPDVHLEQTWKDHLAILEAVEAGDVDRARQALEDHYAGINARLAAAREQPETS